MTSIKESTSGSKTSLQQLSQIDSKRYLKLTPYDQILSKLSIIFDSIPKIEYVKLDRAIGRISAEDVKSTVEIPSKTSASMDGYAIRWEDLQGATPSNPRSFRVRGSIYPDYFSKTPSLNRGEAYYVATGAPLPKKTNVVVRVEETLAKDNTTIQVRRVISKGKDIALKGEDIRKGQVVVRKGQILDPVDVALLIGIRRRNAKVYKVPKVGLLSIGDELKAFDPSKTATGERRVTSNYLNLLAGYVEQFNSSPISLGVCGDNLAEIAKVVGSGLKKCDMILTISGSSVGRHDNVLDALHSLPGAKTIFHGTRVVPIRPSGVVLVRRKPVLIVPGHAVSALLTFFTIALPVLNLLSGLTLDSRKTVLQVETKREITNIRPIEALSLISLTADRISGKLEAVPLSWGSNLISNLSKADGFFWLGPHERIPKNHYISVHLFRENGVAKSFWSAPML